MQAGGSRLGDRQPLYCCLTRGAVARGRLLPLARVVYENLHLTLVFNQVTLENSLSKQSSLWSHPQRFLQGELLPLLTDLRLAILLLLAIAVFSINGTVIEQGQSVAFYQAAMFPTPRL